MYVNPHGECQNVSHFMELDVRLEYDTDSITLFISVQVQNVIIAVILVGILWRMDSPNFRGL